MGILQALFGGSSASNQNNKMLTSALGSTVNGVGGTNNILASLLGMGNPAAGQAGFNTYKDNSGFNFALGEGLKGVTGNAAAKGILNSGMTGKAYMRYGEGLSAQRYNDYIKSLLGFGGMGLQAAGILSDSGKKESSSKGGLGAALGNALSMMGLSDIRLKENIVKIGETEGGLNVYSFTYTFDPETPRTGVMAQEVAEKQPDALGPEIDGYLSVDYGKIK